MNYLSCHGRLYGLDGQPLLQIPPGRQRPTVAHLDPPAHDRRGATETNIALADVLAVLRQGDGPEFFQFPLADGCVLAYFDSKGCLATFVGQGDAGGSARIAALTGVYGQPRVLAASDLEAGFARAQRQHHHHPASGSQPRRKPKKAAARVGTRQAYLQLATIALVVTSLVYAAGSGAHAYRASQRRALEAEAERFNRQLATMVVGKAGSVIRSQTPPLVARVNQAIETAPTLDLAEYELADGEIRLKYDAIVKGVDDIDALKQLGEVKRDGQSIRVTLAQ